MSLPRDPDSPRLRELPLHRHPSTIGLVLAGGFLGTLARERTQAALPHAQVPWGTFAANLCGAFVLGLLLESLLRHGPDIGVRRRLRLLLGVGFCGAFTTYSSLALDVVKLLDTGHISTAFSYGLGTVVIGLAAAGLGVRIAGARR